MVSDEKFCEESFKRLGTALNSFVWAELNILKFQIFIKRLQFCFIHEVLFHI